MKKLKTAGLLAGLMSLLFSSALFAADTSKVPLPLSATPGQGFTKEGLQRIDAFFANEIANNRMPGAVLAAAKNGKLSIYKPYGYMDIWIYG